MSTVLPRGIHSRPHTGFSNDWITPRWVIDALGPFDLDPCASVRQPWPCAPRYFDERADGLAQEWTGHIWLNPPYGSATGMWLQRLADHGDGIALVPARTETRWFIEEVWQRADALLFLSGRLRFHRPDGEVGSGNSGHSSVLIGYGQRAADKLRAGTVPGVFVENWTVADSRKEGTPNASE